MMDKISINQNVFIEISDSTSDLTIIPIEINWEFLAKLGQNFQMHYGVTQKIKAEYLSNVIKLKDCQTVKKEFSTNYDPSKVAAGSGDIDDDFDDEEEEEEKSNTVGIKMSGIAGLVCSQINSKSVQGEVSYWEQRFREQLKFESL